MEIAIIKLGADGDVIRTLPIAKALKERYPESKITWITRGDIAEIISMCKEIDNVSVVPYQENKEFDKVFNLDVEKEAFEILNNINSKEKIGFLENDGYPYSSNPSGEYYINTMFDDELKRNNKKTYQEMIFEVAGIEYKKEKVSLELDNNLREELFGEDEGRAIGIHIGASKRWPSKRWSMEKIKQLVELEARKGNKVVILAGPSEEKDQEEIVKYIEERGLKIWKNNPQGSKKDLVRYVNSCDLLICHDSLCLHISLLLNKKTIALFFCTSPDEIEGYGLLTKIVSKRLYEFFPEKSDIYDESLVNSISVEEVEEKIN